ncbi:lytic murein transglycosylase B [Granulosicoccus antarcticus]|nr:lytic murein transglycosylase B [Granulosicoccus antarcticus]
MIKLSILAVLATVLLSPMTSASLLADSTQTPTEVPDGNPPGKFLQRTDVRDFLDELSQSSGLDRNRLAGIMSRATYQQAVIDAISRPAERTLTWAQYRPIFLKQKRIDQGQEFMSEHAELLERARQTYGVPPAIITAIIGVETFYGRITGKYDVLDSLSTLGFDYPPRAEFFRKELGEFLILAENEGWDVHQRQGSYAGAMGVPQFISSSYQQYAVDFDNDGKRDLFNSIADVIGSVANYFSIHGWVEGAPVADRWEFDGAIPDAVSTLVQSSLSPAVTAQGVSALGFRSDKLQAGTADERLLSVMVLDGADGEEAWVGYQNFYVITRYNHSRLYAMAVLQLAQNIDSTLAQSDP